MIKKIIIMAVCACVIFVIPCSAQSYGQDFPSYCPTNGGSWAEVVTQKGNACVVFRRNTISDVFGFDGNTGYSVVNISDSTVTGYIYFEKNTDYYGNPTKLQCRFQSFGTLEVNVPYSSTYGTRYEWQSLNIDSILNTNINFSDSSGTRYNDFYLYSFPEKLEIIIIVLLIGLILYFILTRCWYA